MAWKEMFDEKFMTAEEAAKMINSGDVVWVGALTSGAYRVFLTNLRVGCGHSISFCLHLCLFDMYEQEVDPALFLLCR